MPYDLSKIKDPFGKLTPPVQEALQAYAESGGKVQTKAKVSDEHWIDLSGHRPCFFDTICYRADPDHYPAEKWQLGMPAAYRHDPLTEVDVWAPETRAGMDRPIISASNCGVVASHMKDGRQRVNISAPQPYDLVPLQTKPARLPSVDWSHVGDAINHIARDAEGYERGASSTPYILGETWFTKSGPARNLSGVFANYDPGDVDWQDSLISRPGHEGDE